MLLKIEARNTHRTATMETLEDEHKAILLAAASSHTGSDGFV